MQESNHKMIALLHFRGAWRTRTAVDGFADR